MTDSDIQRGMGAYREPIPMESVDIDDGFWNDRRRINRERTLDRQFELLDGRLDNLRRAGGQIEGGFEGPYHNDPPVYKWIEAASYALETKFDPDLHDRVDTVVDFVVAAQDDDGYLHSNFILGHDKEDRWTNLGVKHELFALGHLIEAALAHARVTGEDRLLAVARRFADHACEVFGPDGNTGYPGHPEVELALVKLYRETGVDRYLNLAEFFIDERGREDSRFEWELDNPTEIADEPLEDLYLDEDGTYDGRYSQDHAPLREQTTVEGHAVKATFLFAGATALAAETSDESLLDVLDTLWTNMTAKRMYVTGGIGARHEGEAFGEDYELPNESAYAETCAAFGNVLWNHHLSRVYTESRFAAVIEQTLYNGFLAGMSLNGERFSYTNPLASDGGRHRQEWYHTSCCPPNVARLLASLEEYLYLRDESTLYVEQYIGSEARIRMGSSEITLTQDSGIPWNGEITFNMAVSDPAEFTLALRIPEWCDDPEVTIDGGDINTRYDDDGYLRVTGHWTGNERVTLQAPMSVRRIEAHPRLMADFGKEALARGPIVYCVEDVDAPCPVSQLILPEDLDPDCRFDETLLDGVVKISVDGKQPSLDGWENTLYRSGQKTETDPGSFTAIPYYAWDNREPGAMRVWLQSTGPIAE